MRLPLALSAILLAVLASRARAGEPPTLDALRRLPRDCPVVYDNDWIRDVVDDEYVFALAHLGRIHLAGLVLSKDEWDHGRQYSVADGLKDFRENLAIVRRSGFRNVPDVTVGADRLLARPASGKIEDTEPVRSEGTQLIVRMARDATPGRPLIVVVGGPLSTVASALLTEPAIAERLVVLMTDISGYNGSDPWANWIVATRCRLANFGATPLWWPQPPGLSVIPPDRFDGLPDSDLTREMRRVARAYYDRSHRAEHADRCDGLGDGAGLFLLTRPESWRSARKVRVNGAWSPEAVEDGPYHYLDAADVDFDVMREEFFATLRAALDDAARR
jgi:hypothetical protein